MSTTTHAIHNFSAGPCILPPSVLRQASEAVNDLDGSGLSLIEISHRSKPFVAIMEEARQLVRTELALPDHYEVLFLQGGASLGFLTAAMNFLPESGSMDYTVTGTWAKKALKEAQRVGQAKALTSSEESGFDRVPPLPGHTDADFVHITTNNTIFGTQYPGDPQVDAPLIADMSSDIFSVDENDSLDLVINIMKWKNFNHMPVINEAKEPVGLLSSKDIEKYNNNTQNGKHNISDIMQKNIITINQYSSAKDAKKLMKKHNINSLPVVEQNKLIGIITSKDI